MTEDAHPRFTGSERPVPRIRPDLASVQVEGERLILDEVNGDLHHLDPLASVIWDLLDGRSVESEVASDLADVFRVPVEVVQKDLEQLLERLEAQGLLAVGVPRAIDVPSDPREPGYLADPPSP